MNLPRPSANREEYARIMGEGFRRFPERKKNYDEFMNNWGGGRKRR